MPILIRPVQVAARASRRRPGRGSGCLLAWPRGPGRWPPGLPDRSRRV